MFKGPQVSGTNESDYGSEKYLAGIAVLAILLVISCVVVGYFFYQTKKKSNTEAKPETTNGESNSSDIYGISFTYNYENVDNDHFKYTDVKLPAPGEPGDDHVYGNLHETMV